MNQNVDLIKFDSNVQLIKYQVLKEVSRLVMNDKLEDIVDIPEIIVPGPKPITRCCIYHEREVVKQRVKLAFGGNKDICNIIEVLSAACDECPVSRYTVTEACRGCLSHKCQQACHFGAITFEGQRSHINQDLCRECGKCKEACPYNAIADVQRPCKKACPANALDISENKKAVVDDDKCIQCGSCVNACPFGAIMDKSYIVDVLRLLKESKKNENIKVYALVAPSIASQFSYANLGQIVSAIKKLGFYNVVEAALGADIVAENETEEFKNTIDKRKVMTSSCCPAFVAYIRKNYPELMDKVSTSVSPMIAAARLIKAMNKESKVIFIGPCISKKAEAQLEDIKDAVEYVLTFEELLAMFDAAGINIKECEEDLLNDASYFGRIFARSGGVSSAVAQVIDEKQIDAEFSPKLCSGIKECDIALRMVKLNKLKENFIEGMACAGGCISGPACIQRGSKSVQAINNYGNNAASKEVNAATKAYKNIELHLHREYEKIH